MGMLDFIKSAGEKLFKSDDGAQAAAAPANVDELNRQAGDAIEAYIHAQNLDATGLTVTYDGATHTAKVFGVAADQATKEKIVLCCGNVHSVEKVDDQLTVTTAAPESNYYEVVSGDTLSAIAKKQYGDANKYPVIFEANKPMLSDPNKIYPGQKLRIPPQ